VGFVLGVDLPFYITNGLPERVDPFVEGGEPVCHEGTRKRREAERGDRDRLNGAQDTVHRKLSRLDAIHGGLDATLRVR
jgi:hypothetical protein